MSHGLQFDLNYTYSHSIDMGSDAERIGDLGGPGDQIYNAWNPMLQRATSTFDTTHAINSNWVYELPFGRGKAYEPRRRQSCECRSWRMGPEWCVALDQRVPVQRRQRRGLGHQLGPECLCDSDWSDPRNWSHGRERTAQCFHESTTAINSFRQDFAGEVGGRNTLRGPGYFDTDLGLHKMFNITESQTLQFRWETYNAFNNVRFDALTANTGVDQASSFGIFTKTLTIYRRMEFAIRYQF